MACAAPCSENFDTLLAQCWDAPGARPLPRPLAGIRVVTTANALPTAIVGQVLADAGAEVWLLEPPDGSRLRTHAAWKLWARGQRSLRVDLTVDGDRARARALIDRSDVFVDGWGTGVATRLGLDADDLRSSNPALVHARISAFGDDSPLAVAQGLGVDGHGIHRRFHVVRTADTTNRSGVREHALLLDQRRAPRAAGDPRRARWNASAAVSGQSVSVSLAHSFLAYDTWNWLLLVLADRYERAFESAPPFDTDALVPNTPFVFRLLVALSADGQWLQFSQTTDRLWEAFLRTCALDPTDRLGARRAALGRSRRAGRVLGATARRSAVAHRRRVARGVRPRTRRVGRHVPRRARAP